MDGFAQDEYTAHAGTAANPGTAAAQAKGSEYANLVMAHVDCDTIPFFWQWANRFTIFDNIFATEDTPSSPNAIAMIAGQSGETQWVEAPDRGQHVDADERRSRTLARSTARPKPSARHRTRRAFL